MKNIIQRRNKLFVIDKSQLKPGIKVDEICVALYAAIYTEFQGASKHPNYSNMTNLEKLSEINSFAYSWLKTRGLVE